MSGDGRRLTVVQPDPLEELLRLMAGTGAVVFAQSEPRFCIACHADRRVSARWLTWHGFGAAGCPHCTPSPGRRAIPLVVMPSRQDIPREDSAA